MSPSATERYWNKHWEKAVFEAASTHHPIRRWIEEEIPPTDTDSCMEIGCYPGKFLAVFGEKGYELSGIDSYPGIDLMTDWLRHKGYKTKLFYNNDFFNFQSSNTYDIVCSFGFIEHFKNWPEVLDKHLDLLKPGGKLIIDVPNLRSPLYYLLYSIFEPEVLRNHTLSAMCLKSIQSALKLKECRLNYAGYVGDFYFRFVTKHNKAHERISRMINFLKPVFSLFPESFYKRYIGFIATKP